MQRVSGGYTIVETMIVLAVTGVLFASAVLLFQGQQGRSEFSDSMRDLQSKLQDWSNDVSTGFYPVPTTAGGGSGYKCDFTAAATRTLKLTLAASGVKANGTSEPCIYIGKVIQFIPNSSMVKAYTIVGQRTQNFALNSSPLVTSLEQAAPTVARDPSANIDLTENYELRWGSETQPIVAVPPAGSSSTTPTYAMAIYSSFGSQTNAAATNSNSVTMYRLPNRNFASTDDIDSCIKGVTPSGSPANSCNNNSVYLDQRGPGFFKQWRLCFKSGTSNQFGAVTFGLVGGSFSSVITYPKNCS